MGSWQLYILIFKLVILPNIHDHHLWMQTSTLYCQIAKIIFFTLNTIVKKHKCISLIRIASVEGKLSLQFCKNKNIRISEYEKQWDLMN